MEGYRTAKAKSNILNKIHTNSFIFFGGNTGSMRPIIHSEVWMVVIKKSFINIGIGDLIIYTVPDSTNSLIKKMVAHKVIGGNATKGFITKGTGNRVRDAKLVKHSNYVGTAHKAYYWIE